MNAWRTVCSLERVKRQGALAVDGGEAGGIAIFRTHDDCVFAVANHCPHRHGPLADGLVHGHRVTCPLHNYTFDLQSGRAVGPDEGQVRVYPVRIEGGEVQVQIAAMTEPEGAGAL